MRLWDKEDNYWIECYNCDAKSDFDYAHSYFYCASCGKPVRFYGEAKLESEAIRIEETD